MPKKVLKIKKSNPQIQLELAIRDKILEYCIDVPFDEITANILAVLNFGGWIQFDIPFGSCIIRDSDDSIILEIEISKCPYPLDLYKVASVKNGESQILMLINEIRDDSHGTKTCKIMDTYGNDENLSNTELGRLWVIHAHIYEHPIHVFHEYKDAKSYFDLIRENMQKVKMYEEIRDQFLHSIPVNVKLEGM